ncbi:MAG: DUF2214 family protein [Proteobacteria bacterium]|nr:MAG: DUF2214 family protein [Pseudomonadota bacterium]
MDLNFLFACAHHLAVFTLVAVFAAEFALLRPGLNGAQLRQLARIDAAYGGVATLVIVIGILRVWLGGTDPWYYLTNHAFWGKMAAFLVMGLLTIQPTVAIRKWVKAGTEVADYMVPAEQIARSRRFVHLQAGVLVLIPLFAAAMARGYGS